MATFILPETQFLAPGPLLVAVSGGSDSVALLQLLIHLASEHAWELTVAHINHNLRINSLVDECFVKKLAQKKGLTYLVKRIKINKSKLSPEEAARLARREALMNIAAQIGAKIIALAHTADDQAETLLMRILAGTGPTGLAGMKTLIPPWWRPLLKIRRADLRSYLTAIGQPWREDPSNHDLKFTRNRLRNVVLPLLQNKINPRVVEALGRLATLTTCEEEYWQAWCDKTLRRYSWYEGPSLCLELNYLTTQNLAIQRRLIRQAINLLLGKGQHLLSFHIDLLLNLAKGRPGSYLNLPEKLIAWRENAFLYKNCLRLSVVRESPKNFQAHLDGPGWVWLPTLNIWLAAEIHLGPPQLQARGPEAWLPLSDLIWPLIICHPNPGVRFRPLGAPGSRRLSRILIDIKVPIWWRQRTLLLLDQEGPWWAGPWFIAERARINDIKKGPWLHLKFVDRDNPRRYIYKFKNNFSTSLNLC